VLGPDDADLLLEDAAIATLAQLIKRRNARAKAGAGTVG
jgi:hypothetical protein